MSTPFSVDQRDAWNLYFEPKDFTGEGVIYHFDLLCYKEINFSVGVSDAYDGLNGNQSS